MINKSLSSMKIPLARCGIFLLAFDSFPLFIGGSIYRPISIFPLLMYFVILCYEKLLCLRIKLRDLVVFFVFISLLLISSIFAVLKYKDMDGVVDFFLTGTLGFISYVSFYDFFETFKNTANQEDFFNSISDLYFKAMIVPCLFGFFEVFNILSPVRFPGAERIYSLVTLRHEGGRIFLVCGEPSWAVLYLIVLFYFIYFRFDLKKRKQHLMVTLLLILFTFSMLGFLSIVIAFILYYFFYILKNPGFLVRVFLYILIGLVGMFLLDKIISFLPGSYVVYRYAQIKELLGYLLSFEKLYKYIQIADNSLFIRFINPIIGLIMCFQNPLLGVGGGYYYANYRDIILTYFPLSVNLMEVGAAVNDGYQTASKNLFCRCFAEFGIVFGFLVLIKFLLKSTLVKCDDKRGLWLLTLLFTVVFNFDSLCYILFIFLLCFFNTYSSYNSNKTLSYYKVIGNIIFTK